MSTVCEVVADDSLNARNLRRNLTADIHLLRINHYKSLNENY
jgi:hypothetical protein